MKKAMDLLQNQNIENELMYKKEEKLIYDLRDEQKLDSDLFDISNENDQKFLSLGEGSKCLFLLSLYNIEPKDITLEKEIDGKTMLEKKIKNKNIYF